MDFSRLDDHTWTMEPPVWMLQTPSADALEIHSALGAAEALEHLISGFSRDNLVMIDPCSGIVAYQQNNCCILFHPSQQPPVQFVQADGLPPSFMTLSGPLLNSSKP